MLIRQLKDTNFVEKCTDKKIIIKLDISNLTDNELSCEARHKLWSERV